MVAMIALLRQRRTYGSYLHKKACLKPKFLKQSLFSQVRRSQSQVRWPVSQESELKLSFERSLT